MQPAPHDRKEDIVNEVQTVRGPIAPVELGATLMHEHVLFDFDPTRRHEAVEIAVDWLEKGRGAGMDSIVCLTPFRQIDWYRQINERVEVNIIVSTGCYLEKVTPEPLRELDEDEMTARFVRELTEGIDGTGIRAGIIKVAADRPRMTEWEKRVFRAAARAHKETRAPIATHACSGARVQLEYLREHGVQPDYTFYSHVEAEFGWEGRSLEEETEYLIDVARQGGSLLFNNFGFEWDTPWLDLVHIIRSLIDAGLRDRVLTSVDANWRWNDQGRMEMEAECEHPSARERDFAYMFTHAVPALKAAGFTDEDIHAFLVSTPERYFAQ
ncbi:MAG: hypothetical protein E3J25_11130 [Anaerolineales bacterium]|nr:MAG: hypothetical protein E3J25_11130 [Anaerolineales bacterium]